MAGIEEIKAERLKKLALLKEGGRDPYPSKIARDCSLAEARARFAELEKEKKTLALVGRVMAIRGQGAIQFIVLNEGGTTFQIVLKKDVLGDEAMAFFGATVDIGDFVSFFGEFMTTERGEESMLAKSWTMAAKSLLPLPEKWHGLKDEEEKLRLRYLDLLLDNDLRELFLKKSKFWQVTREFFVEHGFLEVETPTLELTTGGAEARPFATHHNDYDLDIYLRISVGELWQKRLMAAGFSKTFEIGRVYRNEGSSPEHVQEFTNIEFYWAFADYEDGMNLVQELYRTIAEKVFGTTKFTARGHSFDLNDEWVRIDYASEIKRQTGVHVLDASNEEIKKKLDDLHVKYDGENRERLTDTLWKYCRKNISGPAFLINHPTLIAPLAQGVRGTQTVQMFQPIIAGSELGRVYSELNDPLDQRARFETQQELLRAGDKEAMMADWEFVQMLEHGMPPTCGFGFGERVFSVLVDKPIRETQLFPLMRPKK